MLQKIQKENEFLKNYVMNLAKADSKDSAQGQSDRNNNGNGKNQRFTNIGPIITCNGRVLNWCPFHNKYVTHKLKNCYRNPEHPEYEQKKKEFEEAKKAKSQENGKLKLEMNLIEAVDYTPINPQITLISASSTNIGSSSDMYQPIPPSQKDAAGYDTNYDIDAPNSTSAVQLKASEMNYKVEPHTSFWEYSF